MITQFGWRLPLSPTEKKLKQCLKICSGRIPGTIVWDFSYAKIFQNVEIMDENDIFINFENYHIRHASEDNDYGDQIYRYFTDFLFVFVLIVENSKL